MNEGTTSVPEDWEVEQGVPELDAGYCVEFEAEMTGPDVAAIFVFLPLEWRREDSNKGSDCTRALEIPYVKELQNKRY